MFEFFFIKVYRWFLNMFCVYLNLMVKFNVFYEFEYFIIVFLNLGF